MPSLIHDKKNNHFQANEYRIKDAEDCGIFPERSTIQGRNMQTAEIRMELNEINANYHNFCETSGMWSMRMVETPCNPGIWTR